MNTNYFLLLPYPYMLSYLTPIAYQPPQTPFVFTPDTFTGLPSIETSASINQVEAPECPEISEIIKVEDGSCLPREETSTRPPSRFRYPKKNVQSNVVNQCYSFLTTRSKSLPIVSKLLATKQQINLFYQIMKQGRKKQTKYMGRSVLQELLMLEEDHPVYILYRRLGCKAVMKITELKAAIRGAITYFLKKIIVSAILTSSKLDRATVKQHLSRSRDILAFINRKHQGI